MCFLFCLGIVLKNAKMTKKGKSKANVASGSVVETLVIMSPNIVLVVAEVCPFLFSYFFFFLKLCFVTVCAIYALIRESRFHQMLQGIMSVRLLDQLWRLYLLSLVCLLQRKMVLKEGEIIIGGKLCASFQVFMLIQRVIVKGLCMDYKSSLS